MMVAIAAVELPESERDAGTDTPGPMYRHLLLPTDGSDHSAGAIAAGLRLARSCGASVTIVYTTRRYMPEGLSAHTVLRDMRQYADGMEAEAAQVLAGPAAEARRLGVRCATVHRSDDEPWRAIVDVAAECGCDLIVMASHGRRGIDALLMGSETSKVLTHSRVPVLVYR